MRDAVGGPRAELTRRQRQLRYAWELVAHCWRVLMRHRAEGMAAELTYRTIFAMIPIVVLGLVMFRIIGGLDEVQSKVEEQLYTFFGVPEVAYESRLQAGEEVTVEVPDGSVDQDSVLSDDDAPSSADSPEEADVAAAGDPPPTAAPDPEADQQLRREEQENERRQVQASIRKVLSEMTENVANLDFKSIGVVGLLLFIYAAIALTDSVEHIFNLIYSAPEGRPIHLRIAIQWSMITLGLGLLALSLYLSGEVVNYLTATTFGEAIRTYLRHSIATFASWVLLFLLYALMPNTRVSLRAAAIGAIVAAVLWEIAKTAFQLYVTKAVPYSALYGSLGLIPVFLFWVYITWLIVLFGLVWTYTLQTAPDHVPDRDEDEAITAPQPDTRWYVPLMAEVAAAFCEGRVIDAQQLSQRLHIPASLVLQLTHQLVERQLLRTVDGEGPIAFMPARPIDRISVGQILRVATPRPAGASGPGWAVLEEANESQSAALDAVTLHDVVQRSTDDPATRPPV